MDDEKILKVEESIERLSSKQCRIYFLVQDTKGNAKASVQYIYETAYALLKNGFNPIIMHEKSDYKGVNEWLGEKYMEVPHNSIEEQNLQISPEDFIVIPELYGHVMEQVSNLPCGKIVLTQSYDYIFETLPPGTSWSDYGFLKCITTNETQKEYISQYMKNVDIDIIPPYINETFSPKEKPSKPIVSVHTRDQRDTAKIIKAFYLKYPQYRWITFRDMRGLTQKEFSSYLKDSFVSVWVDDVSGFGTFPIESMLSMTPVIGKVPNMKPEWMNEKNGVWTYDINNMSDILAEFIQNWLEDNIDEVLYQTGYDTAVDYNDYIIFESNVINTFGGLIEVRKSNFEGQLEKIKVEEQV